MVHVVVVGNVVYRVRLAVLLELLAVERHREKGTIDQAKTLHL